MAFNLASLVQILPSKRSGKTGGQAYDPNFNPSNQGGLVTVPQYRDHLTDLFDTRTINDSRALLRDLFKFDPDMSAALHSALTLANTEPIIVVRDLEGNLDREATQQLMAFIKLIFTPTDYTQGFQLKPGFKALCSDMRYMGLLRGAIGNELVLDKKLLPAEIRTVDMSTVKWYEAKAGQFKPTQLPPGSNNEINLDIPTFFVSFYRRDPTTIYGESAFVSAINTIAARQAVINDLYRIMRVTGYPRMDVKVLEEVVLKNAPANIRTDPEKMKAFRSDRLREVSNLFTSLRPDQAAIHWDSIEIGIINDKTPGMAVDISAVIDTLNSQNQAGLKTMATVIGRGQQGVNTASAEVRFASMMADELNEPVGEQWSNIFSFILHSNGYQGFAEVRFRKAEIRPDLELEPQLVIKAARLKQDLSLGLITDDEYHFEMYGRLRPDSAPLLQGTNFMPTTPAKVDTESVSPNSDPLGRSVASEGSASAKSNAVK